MPTQKKSGNSTELNVRLMPSSKGTISPEKTKIIEELQQIAEEYVSPNRSWGPEDDVIIRAFYNKVPMRVLADKLNRSISAVSSHARRLNIQRRKS